MKRIAIEKNVDFDFPILRYPSVLQLLLVDSVVDVVFDILKYVLNVCLFVWCLTAH